MYNKIKICKQKKIANPTIIKEKEKKKEKKDQSLSASAYLGFQATLCFCVCNFQSWFRFQSQGQ